MRSIAATALSVTLLAGLVPFNSAHAQPWRDRADELQGNETDAAEQWIEVVFSTGRVVFGKLIEESEDTVTVMVHIEGLPPTRAQYPKRDVIEIRRGLASPGDKTAEESGDATDSDAAPTAKKRPGDFPTKTATGGDINDATTKFYFADISGDVGRSVTRSLLERYFEDIDDSFNDLIEVPNPDGPGTIEVVDPAMRDKNIVVFTLNVTADPRFGYQYATSAVRRIGDLLEHEMDVKQRRVIYVVDSAEYGGSLLMFTSPEVYFTPDAEMVGYGLADFIGGGADDVVREKWIGITLSAMTSIAHSRGYGLIGENVVKAMARSRYWFAYRMDGGKAVTTIYEPDNWDSWTILSDDGEDQREDNNDIDPNKLPGEHQITSKDVNPARDVLELNADHARRLGLSKGTLSSIEDLAFELGVERNYVEYASLRARTIAAEYSEEVTRMWERVAYQSGDLWRDYADLQRDFARADNTSEQINAQRRMIRIIQNVISIVNRYDDINFPVPQNAQLEIWIEQHRQTINRIRANR